jgi:hypothetical protein
MSGKLRVAREVLRRADMVGYGEIWRAPRGRVRALGDVAMPLAAYLGRPGRASSGACRRLLDQRRVQAISWDHGRRVGHDGRGDGEEKQREACRGRRGRHGHG